MSLTIKVVLIGESGVGKSCIISRYTKDNFSSDMPSTTGACFNSKEVSFGNNKCINFEIWDTAGQERYRSLTKVFYKSANVCILVYDITRKESFDELKEYWIDEIKENTNADTILAVIGNKSDLYEHEEVKKKEGTEFAKEIGAIFKLASAKKNIGIEELFETIGKKILGTVEDVENQEDNGGEQKHKLVKENKEKEKEKIKCCGKIG
jgi:Ras-related protein Rab-11A